MSIPPDQMMGMVDSAIEAVPGMEVEVDQPEDFAGGAEVMDDGAGGAIIQALLGGDMGAEVVAEPYDHNANLAEVLDDQILAEISSEIREHYETDLDSRSDWEEGYTKGLDLLGVKYQERTQPFQGASGVTHPIIAESVTQFQAQAYKELLPSGGPVRTTIVGLKTPEIEDQAARVKNYMNYLITDVMEEFDPDMDQMLFYLPLSGSTFKKVYYDETKQRPVSRFVPAEDLVVPYTATDLATASRITHVLRMDENQVRKLQVAGVYRDVDISADYETDSDPVRQKVRELDGLDRNEMEDQFTILETHIDLDIEGFEDLDQNGEPTGVKLPYIVTLDQGSGEVLSVRRNYAESDPLKKKIQYFVHYKFLPGLGFYGFGLIHMIGGLGKAATSILRQLIDAGTLANLPSGFKARGIRIRNDDEPLAPGEFRDIDAPGGDIRNSIIPLPFKEPSATLGQLLGLLIDSGRRFVSIADSAIAEPGSQQQPVGTTVALLERGMKVMSAIHKRLHYAQKNEFRLLVSLIRDYLPPNYPYQVIGGNQMIKQADFDDRVDVIPVSDPNIFSMAQRVTLAQTQLQLAQSNPEMHNIREAYKRMYQALEVQNIDEILPPPPQPQPTEPGIENGKALASQVLTAFPQQDHDAHIATHAPLLQTPLVQASPSVYGMIMAHIMEHLSHKARLMVNAEIQQAMQQMQALSQVGAVAPELAQAQPQVPPEQIESRVAQVQAELTAQFLQSLQPPAEAQQADPLVMIRQQELAIKAAEVERKRQLDQQELQLEREKMMQKATTDAARIESQEEIADQRADVNMERINLQRQNMNRTR